MKKVRKFALFIILIVLFIGCSQNNTKKYILKSENEGFIPKIIINENDKSFLFSYDILSSYLAVGTYMENNKQLELKTDDGKYHYTFDIIDDSTLRFNQEKSSYIKPTDESIGEEINDGAEFIIESSDVENTVN